MGRYRKDSPSAGHKQNDSRQNDDDKALWEKVTQSVTALPSTKQRLSAEIVSSLPVNRIVPPASQVAKKPVQNRRNQITHPLKTVTPPADLRLGQHSGIDRANARRLQRGQMPIEDKLDLHGLS